MSPARADEAAPDWPGRVAALLLPVPGPVPAGRAIAHGGAYARIIEARREENAALPQGVWVREVKQADWPRVEQLCSEALRDAAKDLTVACWLTESWSRQHGFAGLAAGLRLIDGLCGGFWPDLHPALGEDGDPDARIVGVAWLDGRSTGLRLVPLIGGMPWDALRRAEPDRADLAVLADALADAEAALDALEVRLDARCGRDAPSLRRTRRLIDEIAGFAAEALTPAPAPVPAPVPIAAPAPVAVDAAIPAAAPPPPSRQAAYDGLRRAAAMLRQLEPHSPVPLVIEQVAGWGALSLTQLEARLRDAGSDVSTLLAAIGFVGTDHDDP